VKEETELAKLDRLIEIARQARIQASKGTLAEFEVAEERLNELMVKRVNLVGGE
jgi:hypothetical protein